MSLNEASRTYNHKQQWRPHVSEKFIQVFQAGFSIKYIEVWLFYSNFRQNIVRGHIDFWFNNQ